jgi:hypothetical protein
MSLLLPLLRLQLRQHISGPHRLPQAILHGAGVEAVPGAEIGVAVGAKPAQASMARTQVTGAGD